MAILIVIVGLYFVVVMMFLCSSGSDYGFNAILIKLKDL